MGSKCVWEISEGHTTYIYLHYEISSATMRSRVSRVQSVKLLEKLSTQVLFNFLVLGDVLGVSGTNWKEEEEASYKQLKAHTNNMYGN